MVSTSVSAPPHSYALLVTAGLEDVAAASIAELLPGLTIRVLPRAQLARGREAGAAGGVGVLLVDSAGVLPPAVYASPCVAAALALVVQCELPEGAPLAAVEEPLTPARWQAAWALRRAHGRLRAAAGSLGSSLGSSLGTLEGRAEDATLAAADADDAAAAAAAADDDDDADDADAPRTYRVATLRGGAHPFDSRQVDAALGAAVHRLQPRWRVELESPDACLLCLLVQRSLLIGLLLPPFAPRKSDPLPLEPTRAWLCAGLERPHMRPSRAAALVRLAAPLAGEIVLDPCGGIGLLAIEAAAMQEVRAISLDLDAPATEAARANAEAAARGGALRGTVEVRCADALQLGAAGAAGGALAAASVDLVLADLPYGAQHARLDVGALLRALSRVVRPGGRCLLVANAGPGGVAAACAKAAARFPHPGAWRCVGDTAHWAGGVACCALMLVRVGARGAAGASGGAGASVGGSGAAGEGGVGGASSVAGDACGDGGGGVPGASDAAATAAAASEAEADVLHLKKVARRV